MAMTAALWLAGIAAARADGVAPLLRLEIEPTRSGKSLAAAEKAGSSATTSPLTVSRLDFLLSGLALRDDAGKWIESRDWFAFFSLEKGRLRAEATGTPAGRLTALRFNVGVPASVNEADPAQWEPGHALHPQTNGLHWGWQGGYVFMALEGRWKRPDGSPDGFSYHLARPENLTAIELPLDLQGGGPATVHVQLDVDRVLGAIDFAKDGTSTHSRPGDPLAARIKERLPGAFSVKDVSHDLFQSVAVTSPAAAPLPTGTTGYRWKVTERFPKVTLPADNPLTEEGVALGRLLFQDTRLSSNGTQSCASCHSAATGFADSRRFSLGAEGHTGRRQAMPLSNLAWVPQFFWDGRAATLRQQVTMPIQDPHEMNRRLDEAVEALAADAKMRASFQSAFGAPGVTPSRLAMALEQFLLTLISQDSRFDRAVRKVGELTAQEKRGLELFVTEFDPARGLRGADCFHCHGGTLFTDHKFANNGLELSAADTGRMEVTGKAEDRGRFRTPSLRNVGRTAPYMHDGRFATLEEVVEHYDHGVRRTDTLDPNLAKHPPEGLGLGAADKAALAAFLRTLDDEASSEPVQVSRQ